MPSPPARCVSLLNFLLCKTHGLPKLIESVDQERASTAFRNWKEHFDPSISHPNAPIPLHPSDTVVRQEIPLKPEIFHGRDDFVEAIAHLLLQEETSRICILGPGGMGKTSVSLAVVELPLIKKRFPGGNCVWVPCIEATSATLFLEILYIQLQVPGDGDKQVTLEKIMSELDASKKPRLILLDNFETPWNAPGRTQKQVSDILRKVAMLSHVAILVTMRGTYPPCDTIEWQSHTIQPTDKAACRRIFHDINPNSKNDPNVDRLLTALGHMPFAVTLMANLGKRGKSTANELLQTWYTSGTDMLSVTNSPEKSMNRSISLSVDSEFVKQDPDALLLLAILSLLPAGTTTQNLRWWATSVKMIPSAIATLSDAGLLVENTWEISSSPVLFVLPVVQSFMQQQGRVAGVIRKQVHSSCCEYVLAHVSRDSTFPGNPKALAAEDTNIQSILFSSPTSQHIVPSDITMEALIVFSWHRCDTKPNLEIANHTVTAAKVSRAERYIASAVWCLGRTYTRLGDHHSSYAHLQEAYRLFNTLLPGDVQSQRLGGQCGIDLVDTARMVLWPDIDEIVSLARDVQTKCAVISDNIIRARSLVLLGLVLHEAQQPQEALRYLDQARTMLMVAGDTFHLASAYQITSRVHYGQGRLLEALDAVEEAWKYAQLTEHMSLQAAISLGFVKIFFSTDRDTEAWEYLELSLMKASYIGDRLTVARVLEYMGYGYLRRGDYQNAYGAYEAALEKYLGTVDEAFVTERCEENMARIKKEENTEMIIGFYRPGLDIDKTLFYPLVQAFASQLSISDS
jgi:tetratricopeptide (TPR) repeat protein